MTIYLDREPSFNPTSIVNPTSIGEEAGRKKDRQSLNALCFTRQDKSKALPEKVIKPSPPQVCGVFERNGCGGAGRTRYALSGPALTVSRVIKRKRTTQAVANLKEASILRAFIRFIRGHTGEPKHRLERGIAYWHFLIEGAMRSAQNKKASYRDNARYELRHPTSERGSLIRILPGARASAAEARR